MRNLLSVSIAAVLMVGCAPMKEATTAKVDASFVANKADTGATLPKWESFFSDPRLQALIQQALSNNRDVRLAWARVSEARAQYGVTRADRFPSVDGVVSGTRSSQPADISPMGRRFDLTKGEVGISLPSYELDLWGRVAKLTEAAQASYLATEANALAVQLALVGDIANAYYQWLETAEKLKISGDIYQNRLAIRGIIDKRMAVGLSTETERLQAEALNDGLLRDSAEISRQHKAAVNTLALLVGAPVSDASIGTGLPLAQQADSSALHSHAPSSLLLRRPDVQAAEGAVDPCGVPSARRGLQPVPRVRLDAGGRAEGDRERLRLAGWRRRRRLGAIRWRASGAGDRAVARISCRGDPRDGELGAGGGDPRGARLRLLPAEQAGRVGGVPLAGHAVGA